MSDIIVSQMDIDHLKIIRQSIIDFMIYVAKYYAKKPGILLDIAPQIYEGAKPFFLQTIKIETFDINPASGCTYIGDICTYNNCLKNDSFDYIVCTEVLEHTLQPFNAVAEIWRILKPGGIIFLSVPFNLRIHGPLPDCWRFTEHGLRVLLKDFSILELNNIETLERQLMPVHYTVVAQKLSK
ncbi:methyltransferase domain-containing protein [Nostoc sp.]|uniref:methyltransferase domain-containing protein n=1 Tax=Nostoc sp. TaxID=1180 RepID=UPI002FFAEEE9